jgi:hypothetical protein
MTHQQQGYRCCARKKANGQVLRGLVEAGEIEPGAEGDEGTKKDEKSED